MQKNPRRLLLLFVAIVVFVSGWGFSGDSTAIAQQEAFEYVFEREHISVAYTIRGSSEEVEEQAERLLRAMFTQTEVTLSTNQDNALVMLEIVREGFVETTMKLAGVLVDQLQSSRKEVLAKLQTALELCC